MKKNMQKRAFIYADEREVFVEGTQAHLEHFLAGIALSCTRALLRLFPPRTVKEIIIKSVEKGIEEGTAAFLKGDWS